ncbi:MAG: phospholipid carrier-dependent glycosyltransferase [Calditrichaeota bacterium]|nr:MAG: phospholipid carrier-dependent glycosyltransferase [Calditrichota bacterium]
MAFLTLSLLPYGIGLGSDSAHYLSIAENLQQGHGFATSILPWNAHAQQVPVAVWPPLYPLLLAALPIAPETTAFLLHILLYGLNIFIVGWIVQRATRSRLAGLLAGASMLVSPAILFDHSYAYSEPLFIFLSLCSLAAFETFRRTRKASMFWLMALLASLAMLTRYIGVALFATLALLMLIDPTRPGKQRFLLITKFLGFAALLPLAWVARNFWVTQSLAGDRVPSEYSLVDIAKYFFTTLGAWFIPEKLLDWTGLLAPALVLAIGWMAIYLFLRQRKNTVPRDSHTNIYAVFLMIFGLLICMIAYIIHFSHLNTRLLSPMYPALVIVVWQWAFSNRVPYQPKTIVEIVRQPAYLCLIILMLVLPFFQSLHETAYRLFRIKGGGLQSVYWRHSDIAKAARTITAKAATDLQLYSNEDEALYLITHKPVHAIPWKDQDIDALLAEPCHNGEKKYIVLLKIKPRPIVPVYEKRLQALPQWQLIGQYRDGKIYQWNATSGT